MLLRDQCVMQATGQVEPVIEHLQHGAARRVQIMARALKNIFRLFPPNTERPLHPDDLADVQINLHAYFINLYGVFENFAWAFVHRHGLETQLNTHDVGLFHKKTRKLFPQKLAEYVASARMVRWRDTYLKTYRDALAHRVPLYVPPSVFTQEEGQLYQRLFEGELAHINAHEFAEAEELAARRAELGKPNLFFVPAFSQLDKLHPVYLHPQLISDSMTVVECGRIFFDHWQQRAQYQQG